MMGPIERELRGRAAAGQFCKQSEMLGADAYQVFCDAMFSLGDQWGSFEGRCEGVNTKQHWPEAMSEAIEAAEALGL